MYLYRFLKMTNGNRDFILCVFTSYARLYQEMDSVPDPPPMLRIQRIFFSPDLEISKLDANFPLIIKMRILAFINL
jgi:hypothetical protein